MAARDRDKRIPYTPHAGVELQPVNPTPVPSRTDSWERLKTDVHEAIEGESSVEGIDRRVKETKNTSLTTLDRVDTLRREVNEDMTVIHTKVDGIIAVVSDLRQVVGRAEGQNELIIGMLQQQNKTSENREHVITTTRIAEVEVDKTRQLSDIEIEKHAAVAKIADDASAKAAKREILKTFLIKVVMVVGGALATLGIAYLSHCGA